MKLPNDALQALDTIPKHLHGDILGYVEDHRLPGAFLRAVIENDLMLAVSKADEKSGAKLREIVVWFLYHAPSSCWGDPQLVQKWLEGAA